MDKKKSAKGDTDMNELSTRQWLGARLDNRFPPGDNEPGEKILSVQEIFRQNMQAKIQNVSFDISREKYLDFTGLVGAGRTGTSLETIFRNRQQEQRGNIIYDGKIMNFSSPRGINGSWICPDHREEKKS